jgi:hypothetical protein
MLYSDADPKHEKRGAYEAAAKLLAGEDDASLRYAALELRRCLEAVVYEKLKLYGDLLPERAVKQWQPPQAFNALIEIEPNAEATSSFAVASEREPAKLSCAPFTQIGVDERPNAKWLKKTWNSLGSHLHAEWPFASSKKPKRSTREFLQKTLSDLSPFVNNQFSGMIANTIAFECRGCEATVKVMVTAPQSAHPPVCLSCGVRYRSEEREGGFEFFPDEPPFKCDCGTESFIGFDRLKPGYEFACRTCGLGYVIVGADWKFALASEAKQRSKKEE